MVCIDQRVKILQNRVPNHNEFRKEFIECTSEKEPDIPIFSSNAFRESAENFRAIKWHNSVPEHSWANPIQSYAIMGENYNKKSNIDSTNMEFYSIPVVGISSVSS